MTIDDLYAKAHERRNLELTTLWTQFNIQLLLNGGLLAAFMGA